MYNVKDNAEAKLQVGLSSLATTIVVEIWSWINFPEAPFIAVLNKRDDDWNITKSEKVEVTAKDWDQFTANRWFEDTTPSDFNAWDYLSLFVIARHIQDLQSWIATNWEDISALWIRMTSAEEAIEDLQRAWAIDHLETNLMIGEKYTANDKLFAQFTPKAANCDVAIPIGNVAANTQLHIQRASSCTAWNTLKLKLRKVWEPTTKVVVDIQKAVVANNGTEYYRYWDWTTIATAELPYSTFTTSWQEVTFTFDNEFWWGDESEVLAVIVHQNDDIVNATNYYELAADSSQYWEAFRVVFVNWDTRTFNKMMPYCEWPGLASAMLCRCESTRYTVPYDLPVLLNASGSTTSSVIWRYVPTRNGQNIKLTGHVTCSVSSSYSNRYGYFNLFDWGNWANLMNKQWNINEDISWTGNKSSTWANLLIQIWSTYSWRQWSYSSLNIYTTNWSITKTQKWTLVAVNEVKTPGNVIAAVIVWKVWGEFFDWGTYSEPDKYNVSFSVGWGTTNSNWWFEVPCDWNVRIRINNNATDHYNYIDMNWQRIMQQWYWGLINMIKVKKWDYFFGYADYSWWNAYADFYPD